MPVSKAHKLNPQPKQAMQTLLGFLLGLLELPTEAAQSLDRFTRQDLFRAILPETLRASANPLPAVLS